MKLIEQFENEWVFEDPTITLAIDDEFEEALEASRRGDLRAAERIARAVVRKCPNHIDALHHLAIWTKKQGDTVTAYAFCQAAVSIGLHAIPPDFQWDHSRLAWGHLENRPFMRAYHNLAIHRMEQQAWEAAIEILSRLLAVNPNDNQGVRYELPGCWFETGDIATVIEHCRRHDDDGSPFMLYPNALAHVLADDTPAAQRALKRAILAQPPRRQRVAGRSSSRTTTLTSRLVHHRREVRSLGLLEAQRGILAALRYRHGTAAQDS